MALTQADRATQRRFYQRHRTRRREQSTAHYHSHRDERLEKMRAYYGRHRNQILNAKNEKEWRWHDRRHQVYEPFVLAGFSIVTLDQLLRPSFILELHGERRWEAL